MLSFVLEVPHGVGGADSLLLAHFMDVAEKTSSNTRYIKKNM